MLNNTPIKKRFIAGAVCPKCGAMDKIQMFRIEDADHRECVECGFTDKILLKSEPKELETRVNVTEEDKAEQTQVVQIQPLS